MGRAKKRPQPPRADTPETRRRFLALFVNAEPAELDRLGADVAAFPTGPANTRMLNASGGARSWPDAENRQTSAPPALLAKLQAAMRSGVAELSAGRPWQLPAAPERIFVTPDATKTLETRTGPVVERFPLLRTYEGDLEGAFLATAADVLVESWGDSLRACPRPSCGRLFVPVRRQGFCSPKCSQAVRWERYVEAHPKRDRDHAAEYESRQTRRLGLRPGSRVKIGSKRPRTKGTPPRTGRTRT